MIKKYLNKYLQVVLLAGAAEAIVTQAAAQTTVAVDSAKTWIGYMNVFDLSNNYQFGSEWGTADLSAVFTGTNYLTITPNTSIDRDKPTDPYWWDNGAANRIMDASFYVQDDTLAGQTITFSGHCLTNSLTADYSTVAFIKDFAPDYSQNTPVTVALVAGEDFTVSLPTTVGHHIQYGFETIGPDARINALSSLGKVVVAVSNADPTLSPVGNQVLVEGQTARFSVLAKGTAPFQYNWNYVSATGTNLVTDGGRISGADSGSLTISNIVAGDAGQYQLTVANRIGSAQVQSTLVVLPLAQVRTNLLIDPGFESGAFVATADLGWVGFNGAVFQSTNDTYFGSDQSVAALDGFRVLDTYSTGAGSYNGAYQERPAAPGDIFTASVALLTPAVDALAGTGEAWLELQFRGADDGLLGFYKSSSLDISSAPDQWITLQATNQYAADFVTLLGTSWYPVAPVGTTRVRFQITYHADSGGSVYADSGSLRLVSTKVSVVLTNGAVQVSFPTLAGPMYQVLYKDNLGEASWHVLKTVAGDGTRQTVSDPASKQERFYTVSTQ